MMLKVPEPVLQVLSAATFDGPRLILNGQLDRKLYVDTNRVIEAAGGKWNRKSGAHVFDGDAIDTIEPIILTGEYSRIKQDFGQFDTPRILARRVVQMAGVAPGQRVLEPSAGLGNIAIEAAEAGGQVACVEIDERRIEALKVKRFASIICADFLSFTGLIAQDRVVMNPPFAPSQADIRHVLHALKFLKPDGRLVSIMSAGITFRDNRLTSDFREFVSRRGGSIEKLPDGSFRESGTMINTCIVSIPGEAG